MYLHNRKDFKTIVRLSAAKNNVFNPYLAEKDYWIMHCLHSLSCLGLQLELKGGTSLSKGYGIVERFSEDIDIKIEPDEPVTGLKVYTGKNHDKKAHRQSRKNYFDWLARALHGKINGITSVARAESLDDKKFRNGAILLSYKSHFREIEGIRPTILLEVGFDKTVPNSKRDITSWTFDEGHAALGDAITDNRAKNMLCYDPRYTFVEKLQAIVSKYTTYKNNKHGVNLPNNFLRHYYDIYYLLGVKEVVNFINTDEYKRYKQERFRSHDTVIKNCEGFSLKDTEERKIFMHSYQTSSALYYKGQIPLDKILKRIADFLHIL